MIAEKTREETVLKHLNELRYTREYVDKVTQANQSGDEELTAACLILMMELNKFLKKSLEYLSRHSASNLVRGLTSSSVDERRGALVSASKTLDKILQRKINIILITRDETSERKIMAESHSKLDFEPDQDRHRRTVCQGTGIWFIEKTEIQDYIHGKAGWIRCEGKGTL